MGLLAFPKHILKQRIKKFFQLLPDNSVAIIFSPSYKIKSNDVEFRFRPSSRVLYLTGIKDPQVIVVFSKKKLKDSIEEKTYVFRKRLTEDEKIWIGEDTPDDEIKSIVDEVLDLYNFDTKIYEILQGSKHIFYPVGEEDQRLDLIISSNFRKLRGRARYGILIPNFISDVDLILGKLRIKKDDYEINLIKTAVSITKKALDEVEKKINPGVLEYEIEAEIIRYYRIFGGFEAFPTIVASGKNSVVLHYSKNSGPVGIPCIVDTGVEFNFYSSDITRTFLNYDFASNQKEKEKIKIAEEIKKGVENIQKTIISSVKEGISFKELNDLASLLITDFLIDFGILKVEATKDEILEKKIYKVFYPHSIGHHLGLDVHDVCQYYDEDGNPVKIPEGAVITIEPGIYIPNKEKVELKEDGKVLYEIQIPEIMRGIGVRIEDDVLVLKNGFEIL